MLRLRTLGIAMALVLGASGVMLTTGCGEAVLQVGVNPPPGPPPAPPPPPEPEPVAAQEPQRAQAPEEEVALEAVQAED